MQRNMSLTPKISATKDSPDVNKLGYKLDTKLSSLGLMRGPLYNVGGPMTSGASGLSLPKGPVSLKSVGEQSKGASSFPRTLKPPVNTTNKGEGKTVILNSNGAQTRRLETINQTIQGNSTRSGNSVFSSKWNNICIDGNTNIEDNQPVIKINSHHLAPPKVSTVKITPSVTSSHYIQPEICKLH